MVNTFGAPARVDDYGDVPVIEDCAHSFGGALEGGYMGSRTPISIVSFSATKLVGGAGGGAIVTSLERVADLARKWRHYDNQPVTADGANHKISDVQSALALVQVRRLSDMIECRKTRAHRYTEGLKRLTEESSVGFTTDGQRWWSGSRVWYRYCVEVPSAEAFTLHMQNEFGIEARRPIFNWLGRNTDLFPVAKQAYQQLASLPLYPTLEPREQDVICGATAQTLKHLWS